MAVRVRLTRTQALKAFPLLAALGAAAVAYGWPGSRHPVPATAPPAGLGQELRGQERSIVWAVRSKDLLSCHTAGSVLRHVQASGGPAANLTLVAIGTDGAWAASLLRTERLKGTVRVVSDDEYEHVLGVLATPAIYVLSHGQRRAALRAPLAADEASLRNAIENALKRPSAERRPPGASLPPGPPTP